MNIRGTVVVMMIGITLSARSAPAQLPAPASERALVSASANTGRQFSISFVESKRKWKLGFNNRSYDKISSEIQDLLVPELATKGSVRVDSLSGPCCKVAIELVEVSEHTAAFGKAGIDIVATIAVQDAGGRQLYSKVYRGESRAVGIHTWGGMIDTAEKEMVKTAVKDDDLIKSLVGPAGDSATR